MNTESADTPPRSTRPFAPVSWGEIIDKITILEIKRARFKCEISIANVDFELGELRKIFDNGLDINYELLEMKDELRKVNLELWEIEDDIREKERLKIFDQDFIDLARSVYYTNDKRSSIKRRINEWTKSEIIEEKNYADYA